MCACAISLCNYSQKDQPKTLFLVPLSLGDPVALVVKVAKMGEAEEIAATSVMQRVAEVLVVAVEIMVVNAVLVAANHAAKF